MSKKPFLTVPPETDRMPSGVPFIIGNEFAERFSFYGMKAILVVFMTQYLRGQDGLDVMDDETASGWYHTFVSAAYFMPLFGSLLADIFFGKYLTIITLSIVYCAGHLALALDETRLGLMVGLTLIAIGAGGIKPCVSAHVGDQFGKRNQILLQKVYGWFYLAINLGSFLSMLITPILLNEVGPQLAFGVPGILMFLATFVFWLGRNRFVHVPAGGSAFVRETLSVEGMKTVLKLFVILGFATPFWALFDQTGSSWITQAQRMDLNIFGWDVLPSQVQSVNSLFIILLIPLFTFVIYPVAGLFVRVTPLRKMSVGFFFGVLSFVIPAFVEHWIQAGETPHVGWQVLAYFFLTVAEIMISITSLEFAYTQAPKRMKSLMMFFYLLPMSLGNAFTAGVNFFIAGEGGEQRLQGPAYFWFFCGIMAVTAVLFVFAARLYKPPRSLDEERGDEDQGFTEPEPEY